MTDETAEPMVVVARWQGLGPGGTDYVHRVPESQTRHPNPEQPTEWGEGWEDLGYVDETGPETGSTHGLEPLADDYTDH